MSDTRARKILRDLSANIPRTMLVVLSIAVGIFAIASILGARQVLLREFDRGFAESNKYSISYTLSDDSSNIEGVIRKIVARDDVRAATARRSVSVGFSFVPEDMSDAEAIIALPAPGEDKQTMNMQAVTTAEFENSEVSRFEPLVTRTWPPGSRDLIIEASALQIYDLEIGDRILLDSGNAKAVYRIAGFAHDINVIPTMFFKHIEAFAIMDALTPLNVPTEANSIMVTVDPSLTRVQVARIAENIQDRILNPANVSVDRMEVPEPGYHFFGTLFEAVSVLLLAMAFMALALSAFLVITTTNAILVQQTRQLGIMKAIGGRRTQIAGLYFGLVLGYGALALVIGLPIGILFGRGFIDYAAGVLNFHIADMSYPGWVLVVLCAVGLLLPLLAALVPIISGVKRPIIDAFSSYANRTVFGGGWLDRTLGKIRALPRPTALALRSTFAKKGRLALTLTTLVLATAVVMAVFSARASLDLTVVTIGNWWRYDAQAILSVPAPSTELLRIVDGVDEVIYAETWLDGRASIKRPDGTTNDSFWTLGIPADSKVLNFYYEQGRPLLPGEKAVVVNTELLTSEDYLELPATVTLLVGGREIERPVVGIVTGSLQGPALFMERDDLAELQGIPGAATRLVVQAEGIQYPQATSDLGGGSPGSAGGRELLQERLAQQLDERLSTKGYPVASAQTATDQRESESDHLGILTTFLVIMASALAIVGVIGLTGSMTLTVIESTREIGIMRSVGASHRSIFSIYITQGLVVGTIAWAFGAVLSWPLSYALMAALRTALEMHLSYTFSIGGVIVCLLLVWAISAVASLLPAWRASQVSIRDAISYE